MAKRPLEGIRVLDITVVWAGPYSTMFLADMGAEVIRVESTKVFPSQTRGQLAHPDHDAEKRRATSAYPDRDPGARPWNRSATFNTHARNKHSMTVDLRSPEGKDIFRRLIEVSDVFVENNAVGSMERLGLTYPTLSQWNPRLIMVSSTGMGQTGPWSHFRGFGSHFEALYGHQSTIGYADMTVEGAPNTVAADAAGGTAIAFAVTMALHQRHKTGKGTFIDLAQGENFVPHLGEVFMDYTMNGNVQTTMGNRQPGVVQGCYRAKGNDEWFLVTFETIETWHAFCRAIGQPELIDDERFSDFDSLIQHHDDVDVIVEAWTTDQDPIEAFHLLQQAGVTAGPVLHEDQAYADPHLRARDFFVEVTQEDAGTHEYPSSPFVMSKVPFEVRKPPVMLGEDNDYIYREVLGLSEAEYDHLKELGQIGTDYDPNLP